MLLIVNKLPKAYSKCPAGRVYSLFVVVLVVKPTRWKDIKRREIIRPSKKKYNDRNKQIKIFQKIKENRVKRPLKSNYHLSIMPFITSRKM